MTLRRAVDDWRRGDADFGSHLAAAAIVAGSFSGGEHGVLPENRAGVAADAVGVGCQ